MAIQDIEGAEMDRYLSSLLAFVPTGGKGVRRGRDYLSLRARECLLAGFRGRAPSLYLIAFSGCDLD